MPRKAGTDRPHIVIIAKGGAYWLGGRQYTINLLRALTAFRRNRADFDVSVLVSGASELPFYEPLRPELKVCADADDFGAPFTIANRARWRAKRALGGWLAPRLEETLLRMGATFAYPLRSSKIPSATWIPDFQYKHFPEGSNPQEIEGRKKEFGLMARQAQKVVLSSDHAARDCADLFPETDGKRCVLKFRAFVEPDWVAGDPTAVVARYNLPAHYLLVSNQLIPTKNHAVVLDALAALPERERGAIHVACTGDIYDYRNPGFYNGFLAKIHEYGLRDRVSILGMIPKHDQMQLLRGSLAYLQPSLFEGWNTGVEEAQLLGKPILLSNIPVHLEQAPARGVFFNPRDPAQLGGLMRDAFAAARGPCHDGDAERTALASYVGLQRDFAKTFLAISETAAQDVPARGAVSIDLPQR